MFCDNQSVTHPSQLDGRKLFASQRHAKETRIMLQIMRRRFVLRGGNFLAYEAICATRRSATIYRHGRSIECVVMPY